MRLVVARPIESGSSEYQGAGSHAPIVPTKILGDPVELDRYLVENGYAETFVQPPSNNSFSAPFIYSGQQTDVQLHVSICNYFNNFIIEVFITNSPYPVSWMS